MRKCKLRLYTIRCFWTSWFTNYYTFPPQFFHQSEWFMNFTILGVVNFGIWYQFGKLKLQNSSTDMFVWLKIWNCQIFVNYKENIWVKISKIQTRQNSLLYRLEVEWIYWFLSEELISEILRMPIHL